MCDNCEYEFEGGACCTSSGCQVTLEGFPDLRFSGDAPMYSTEDDEFWLGYEAPEDPYAIFHDTHEQMSELLDVDIRLEDPQLIFRMVFTQLIAAMEAYLADTLIRQVVGVHATTRRLLAQDRSISQTKYTLSQLAENSNFLNDSILAYLRSILYHNLDRVRVLYKIILDFDIKRSDDDWQFLLGAVEHRHDCVHRNGYDSQGRRLTCFTREYARRAGAIIDRMIRSIEMSLDVA